MRVKDWIVARATGKGAHQSIPGRMGAGKGNAMADAGKQKAHFMPLSFAVPRVKQVFLAWRGKNPYVRASQLRNFG